MNLNDEPLILFIRGVYKKDLNDRSQVEVVVEQEEECDEIPNHFTGLITWFKKTNILCGNCGLQHNNPPVFIPEYFVTYSSNTMNMTNINYNNNINDIAIIKLLFCSFPCASTYINTNYSYDERDQKMQGLIYVYYIMTGDKIDYIPQAPYKEELTIFGGRSAPYTIQSFKKHIATLIPFDNYLI